MKLALIAVAALVLGGCASTPESRALRESLFGPIDSTSSTYHDSYTVTGPDGRRHTVFCTTRADSYGGTTSCH